MEVDFGLTEYASGHAVSPVHCILKEMYSDFIVQEILADGKVLPIPAPDAILERTGSKQNALEVEKALKNQVAFLKIHW
uniref:DUF104 domain-containing protein n=1 Tax=Caenorhabditis tropicalis TaxID=1561998 RepID=A0A1I7T5X4_9PELO